jgi:DNA-directed RNA polymerase subunit RPC12/RpoP
MAETSMENDEHIDNSLPPPNFPEEKVFSWILARMPNRPEYLTCACKNCSQKLEFPIDAFETEIACPTCGGKTLLCNDEYGDKVMAELKRRCTVRLISVGGACAKCGSRDYDIYEPSKPWVLTPMSFTGIMAGAVANAMADRIFKPERVCRNCGYRWPIG